MSYQYTGARADEVFVGNVLAGTSIPSHLAGLRTARLGEKALDIEGRPLPGYLPMFVGRGEAAAYDEIMMRRFNQTGKHPRSPIPSQGIKEQP